MKSKIHTIKPIIHHAQNLERELSSRGNAPEISFSSIPKFNGMVWGLRGGELVVIGARSSQGKTAFVTQFAWDCANAGHPTVLLSLEQDEEAILERMFCNEFLVSNYNLTRGSFKNNEDIKNKYDTFKSVLKELPLLITCNIGVNMEEVIYTLDNVHFTKGGKPKVVIIDYIQNIERQRQSAREDTNEYIRRFNFLCKEHKTCGVLCSQINREAAKVGDCRPYMHQLKESGKLEEAADKVILLHWKGRYYTDKELQDPRNDPADYQIIVDKNRNGPCGIHECRYIANHYKFKDN